PQGGRPGRAHRPGRVLRHRLRERGPHPRGDAGQAPPPGLQRAPARRQELPVHRDQPRRGVPARLLHARAAPPRSPVLRAVLERAAAERNRLAAVRHLMERQWAKGEALGTVDVIGVAVEDDAANVQVLQVRDGVLQDRQSFYLETQGADEATVLEHFSLEYYA